MKESPVDYDELLDSWYAAQSRGLSQPEHAAELGIPWTTYKNRLQRARVAAMSRVPESRYRVWDDYPRITGDAVVMGDLHIPLHHSGHINRCIEFAHEHGIKQCVLGGDVLDLHALSRWPDDAEAEAHKTISAAAEDRLLEVARALPAKHASVITAVIAELTRAPADIADEIVEARKVLTALAKNFDVVWWLMGNHENRAFRRLEKSLPASDIAVLFSGGAGAKIRTTPFYHAEIDSAGVRYRVTHPKQAGKGSSKRLVPIHGMNIIQFHNHHFSVQSDPSGQWLAIEPGMSADPMRIDYDKQRDSAVDTHVVGAVAVVDGRVRLLNQWF